jgi:D-alanine-D-alanine ligase
VKPARAGSSVGITKVREASELAEAIEFARVHDPKVIVEQSVEGVREIECAVLVHPDGTPRASVLGEIRVHPDHDFYDFEAKYLDDGADLVIPADIPADVAARVQQVAIQAFEALDCEGLARVDFFVRDDGMVLVNEVNTMPGFTPISMFPRLWAASGLSYPELIDMLIRDALRRGTGLR